jgi:hypothetical protein
VFRMRKRDVRLLFVVASILLSTVVLAASPPAGATNRVPPQLAGQWAIPWQGGTEYLTLADSRFMFFFNYPGGVPAMGAVSVTGNTITFYSSNYCTGTGTYEWSLNDGGLTFAQAADSNDPCQREAILTSGTWTHR